MTNQDRSRNEKDGRPDQNIKSMDGASNSTKAPRLRYMPRPTHNHRLQRPTNMHPILPSGQICDEGEKEH